MKTNREFTKSQRRRLRELGVIAYERDLSDELSKLETEFGRWRAGEIDAHELSDRIHRFHQGPARKLFSFYELPNLDFAVAHAIHRGLITEAEAGADTIEIIRAHLAFLRDHEADV
jgi:hypothetical protein